MKLLPDLPTTLNEDPLFVQAWKQDFHDFTTGYEIPERLLRYMKEQGYAASEGNGLLFSGCGNVDFHVDDVQSKKSLVWCLAARDAWHLPILIVGGRTATLTEGSVTVFNPTLPHAILCNPNKPYLLYVLNSERKMKVQDRLRKWKIYRWWKGGL